MWYNYVNKVKQKGETKMKFVYYDVHYGGQPVSRIDNYNESIMNKLKYIVNYCNTYGIRVIIIGGDLFDAPIG